MRPNYDFNDVPETAKASADGPGTGRERATRFALPQGLRLVPEPSVQERLRAVDGAQNPLLEAAQPLLRALADMPATLDPLGVAALHQLLEREVATFGALCNRAQIRHEHAVAASYALCTALDEAASSTAWGGGRGGDTGIWSTRQLASHFHADAKGGDKLFLLIGRLASNPQDHTDLLELMYQILGLGFEGRFGAATNGRRELETIRNRLLAMLATARGDVPIELSPHWKGVGPGKFRLLRSIPVWMTASVLALSLFGLFAWYKYRLVHTSSQLEQQIAAIGKMRPPPALPVKALRLKELLSAEIARGTVSVDEDARRSAVSFKGDDMFVPGQARLNPKNVPVLVKVADEINNVTGTVVVAGHSDNQPIRTREFPDNQVLSEKRAAAVAQILQDHGVVSSRLQVQGKGDAEPVASDATAVGRAKNRRVDVIVTQDGVVVATTSIGAPGVTPSGVPAAMVRPAPR
jgi:type VI secretion system protein ImpK